MIITAPFSAGKVDTPGLAGRLFSTVDMPVVAQSTSRSISISFYGNPLPGESLVCFC
jgi:hypothetical protein